MAITPCAVQYILVAQVYFIHSSLYLLIPYPYRAPPYFFILSFDSRRDDSWGLNAFKPVVLNLATQGSHLGSLEKSRCSGFLKRETEIQLASRDSSVRESLCSGHFSIHNTTFLPQN